MANEAETVRKFAEYYERQDLEQLVNLFADDAVYHDTFYGSFAGRAKIREMFQMFYRDGRDWVWSPRNIVAQEGSAAVEFFFSFVTTDPRNPGRPVKMVAVGIFDFAGGRIKRFHEYLDVGPVLLQIGLAPEALVRHLQKRLDRGSSSTIPQ